MAAHAPARPDTRLAQLARRLAPLAQRLEPVGAATQATAARFVRSPLAWVLFMGTMFGLPLTKALRRDLPAPPPVVGGVTLSTPLLDETGATTTPQAWHGAMTVLEFTSTRTEDDARVDRMLTLMHRLRNMGDGARVVSVSIEPDRDTPARLFAFAREHNANPYLWTFAADTTGRLHAELEALARETLPAGAPAETTLASAGAFVLLDPDLRVRGFYAPSDTGLDALLFDLGLIANLYRPAPPPAGSTA